MKTQTWVIPTVLALLVLTGASPANAAATVDYYGQLYIGSGYLSGGFVVAGTFAPGFVSANYFQVYSLSGFYSDSVADGGFRPIGSGVLTDANGFFSGSGTTNEPPGTQIYLFGFNVSNPDLATHGFLATGSDPSFLIPADMTSTSIHPSQVSSILFGVQFGGDAIGVGPLTVAEPTSFALTLPSLLILFRRSRRA